MTSARRPLGPCRSFDWCTVDHDATGSWRESVNGDLLTQHFLEGGRSFTSFADGNGETYLALEVDEARGRDGIAYGEPAIRIDSAGALMRLEEVEAFVAGLHRLRDAGVAILAARSESGIGQEEPR